MSKTADFTIVSDTGLSGISLVYAQNEDAYNFLRDENIEVMAFGAAPIDSDRVADLISDAGWEHLDCELV